MGEINWLAVLLGALAFFAVGALWYGVLFAKAWQKAAGLSDEKIRSGNLPLIFGLTFLAELVIALTLWHGIARSGASDRAMTVAPKPIAIIITARSLGINYLYLRKTLRHFLIDAGHFIVGMAAMGGVFLLFR